MLTNNYYTQGTELTEQPMVQLTARFLAVPGFVPLTDSERKSDEGVAIITRVTGHGAKLVVREDTHLAMGYVHNHGKTTKICGQTAGVTSGSFSDNSEIYSLF